MQSVNLGSQVTNMTKPKNQLFCRLDDFTPSKREKLRLKTLNELGLLVSEAVPVFEEATQKAAAFSDAPICILGLVVEHELWFKSAVGLSTTGLMNQIAAQRKISLDESFSAYVVDSQQPLVIDNTLSNAVFANSILTQHCGIRAYLGVPLLDSNGLCLGTLEVMDWKTRDFSQKDVEHIALLARWCLGEFERNRTIDNKKGTLQNNVFPVKWEQTRNLISQIDNSLDSSAQIALNDGQSEPVKAEYTVDRSGSIKIDLLSQLTQELRTPLTSVIGMASVLHREVYGPLTIKQREYLEIIHDSGQNLISLVDEIVNLGILNKQSSQINAGSVDIEMLCQQVINSLQESAKQQQQKLRLSIEPGNRIWSLDKEKVRQALYYLVTSLIDMSEPGGEIRVHVSRRNKALNIAVGISHPWLGEGFGEESLYSKAVTQALKQNRESYLDRNKFNVGMGDISLNNRQILTSSALMTVVDEKNTIDPHTNKVPRDLLGLLFCCHLTELHEGQVVIQGSSNSSYRYVLQFPKARVEEEVNVTLSSP